MLSVIGLRTVENAFVCRGDIGFMLYFYSYAFMDVKVCVLNWVDAM